MMSHEELSPRPSEDTAATDSSEEGPVFSETQRFQRIVLGLSLVMGAAIGMASINGYTPLETAILTVFPMVFVLFYTAKLTTEVRDDGVYVRFFPFHLEPVKIPFQDIEDYHPRRYQPFLDFGGWGIRSEPGTKAYTVSGKKAVRIARKDGKSLLLGSKNPHKLVEAIDAKTE